MTSRAPEAVSRYVQADGVRIHYLDHPGDGPPIVLLHGLSANAHEFGGLVDAGLSPAFRVIAPDLRGRGRSDKPPAGYRMADHAADVLSLLDSLDLDRVILGGHSFGAYLAIYIAAHFPGRVSRLIVIDAALNLHPRVAALLKPSLDRLTRVHASPRAYLAEVRDAPYLAGMWNPPIEAYYRAEILENADGTVRSATSPDAIAQAMQGIGQETWPPLVQRITVPVLLLNAVEAYGPPGTPPLIEPENAIATANAFASCRYAVVPGNHMTMVFGEGAAAVCEEILAFAGGGPRA